MTLKEEFDENGIVIIRSAIRIWNYIDDWKKFYNPQREILFNPVEINGPFPGMLDFLPKSDDLTGLARQFFDEEDYCRPEIRAYNFRFIVKDKHALGPTFLHQDTPYHVGHFNKLSAFVAFTTVCPENGGMEFFLGTHKLGYLGDAGELNPAVLENPRIICPVLAPGDVLFMHSATWHRSGPNTAGFDRVLADIIYAPASDPSVNGLLTKEMRDNLFIRSRVSRIQELEKEIENLERPF